MHDLGYIAPPLSRRNIRAYASSIRQMSKYGGDPYFQILQLVENEMTEWIPDFNLVVSPRSEMGEYLALAHIRDLVMEVREDVYDRAKVGSPWDRHTLAHEVGHFILHADVQLARRVGFTDRAPPVTYRDPDWQASAFAGELLMPLSMFKVLRDPEDASDIFGVSRQAVKTQISAWQREGILQSGR